MNDTLLALIVVSLLFAGYLRFLSRRASRAALGRNAPGIRVPATTRCEHTWAAAQRTAAPFYLRGAAALVIAAALAAFGGLADVATGSVVVAWFVVAFGSEIYYLGLAASRANRAAGAVRCEHQEPAAPRRSGGRSSRNTAASPRSGRDTRGARGARSAQRRGRKRR